MKIKITEDLALPMRKHSDDAGLDLFVLDDTITIKPNETLKVRTGVLIKLPENTMGLILPRSSIALQGLVVHPAPIDEGYRGEIHVIITNVSGKEFTTNRGDRLGQLTIINIQQPVLEVVEYLDDGTRGENGFGSTGK